MMTLNSKISVIVICSDIKTGELKSLNFDFGVVNFDTMKLIFYAIISETLMPQGFLDIEKERKLQYLWYHNFRSYLATNAFFDTGCIGLQKVAFLILGCIECNLFSLCNPRL